MSNVPPSSDGGPPFDGGDALTVSGKRKALLLLEQIKNEIAAVEAWVQTVPEGAGTDAPPAPPPPPPPPPPRPPSGHKKGRRHRGH
jgi:hypothetical protein